MMGKKKYSFRCEATYYWVQRHVDDEWEVGLRSDDTTFYLFGNISAVPVATIGPEIKIPKGANDG